MLPSVVPNGAEVAPAFPHGLPLVELRERDPNLDHEVIVEQARDDLGRCVRERR